jgi:hypothetical protein
MGELCTASLIAGSESSWPCSRPERPAIQTINGGYEPRVKTLDYGWGVPPAAPRITTSLNRRLLRDPGVQRRPQPQGVVRLVALRYDVR